MRVVDLIEKKRDGGAHSRAELEAIVDGYVRGDVPDYQVAAWLMAVCWQGMQPAEVAALTEVMAGRVDIYFCPLPPAISLIREGRLKALAVSSMQRASALPDVPTTTEAGFADSDFDFWVGAFVPKQTPRDVVARIHDEAVKALQHPETKDKLAQLGVETMIMQPDAFDARLVKEVAIDEHLAKAAGIAVK